MRIITDLFFLVVTYLVCGGDVLSKTLHLDTAQMTNLDFAFHVECRLE